MFGVLCRRGGLEGEGGSMQKDQLGGNATVQERERSLPEGPALPSGESSSYNSWSLRERGGAQGRGVAWAMRQCCCAQSVPGLSHE